MAKRKAAKRKTARGKAATTRRKAGRTRSAGKKTASVRKAASKRKASARKKTAPARKTTASRKTVSARKVGARKVKRAAPVAKKRAAPVARKAATPVAKKTAAPPKKTAPRAERAPVRTAPGLNRERRTIGDDDIVQTPPSSLDFDRSASAARSGRRELRDRYAEHTETSPALTGGDVDADWESAYSVGDEAPGGDNPTPDQDLVDDIGRAVGIEYQDNEELKGEAKIIKRDRNRWELDPASSDDWDER
jgi:Family of unknown function (DUF6335)